MNLTRAERSELGRLTLGGTISVRKLNRVKILLLADESHASGQQTDQEIAEKLAISPATVERTRRAYVEAGLQEALNEKPRSGRPPVISGETRGQITALACSTPPEGFGQWSLRLLADKAVELQFIETISHESVGAILKKTLSNRTWSGNGV
ncbi:MAG: helix-turn-helix domain-containing protein [Caldilineaceae bacterium]|nr:helix-turn-helix domain-containing protein [Caldilineaceae bacterium]